MVFPQEAVPTATNSLIVTGLPSDAFSMTANTPWEEGIVKGIYQQLLVQLQSVTTLPEDVQESITGLQDWKATLLHQIESVYVAQLKRLQRVLLVFNETRQAKLWKRLLPLLQLKVYYGQPVDMELLRHPELNRRMNTLQVPHPTRNFLLSPPCSPPIGWTQTCENEPSKGGYQGIHSSDTFPFMEPAASELELFQLDAQENQTTDTCSISHVQQKGGSGHVRLEFKSPNDDIILPLIIVQDLEGDNHMNRPPIKLARTAMPPN